MDSPVADQDGLLRSVADHLHEVEQTPAKKLDEELLRRGERSLDSSTPRNLLGYLLQTGEHLLQLLQQDPRPLTRILEKIIRLLPFDELKATISAEKLEEGLKSTSIPVQLLCLAYLTKAADRPSGASFVASTSSLVQLLVTTWLSIESTEVSERALECIEALLIVDSPEHVTVVPAENQIGETNGQGLMWRRIFYDAEVYRLLFLWTSLRQSAYDLKTKKGQQTVTISQARLFDFVSRVAPLDWKTITTSTIPNVESEFMHPNGEARQQPFGGVLRYAATDMIDSSDFVMELLRRDLFMKLLKSGEENGNRTVPPRLLEAIQDQAGVGSEGEQANGIHL